MSVVDKIYSGYGMEPDETKVFHGGNDYLKRDFPNLSYIKSVRILDTKTDDKTSAKEKGIVNVTISLKF